MTRAELLDLFSGKVAAVMAVDVGDVGPETRFNQDLHADSLDLLEIIESVEAELRRRGLEVRLPDAVLPGLATVGDAVDRLAEAM